MAGHSQFKNIMHKKGRVDAQRSKLFGKLAREITVAAKLGLPDPDMNPRLRAAILAARAENMPKDNIERAIKKAQGGDAESYDEIRYEGYGPGGAALIVEAMTDNRNRTASDIRSCSRRAAATSPRPAPSPSCSTASASSSSTPRPPMPTRCSRRRSRPAPTTSSRAEDGHEVYCDQGALGEVTKALEARFGEPRKSALVWRAQNTVDVDDEAAEKLIRLVEIARGPR